MLYDRKIRKVLSDHVSDFRIYTLEDFCDESAITQNLPSIRTPQQNGVVDRCNRMLIEAIRTIVEEVCQRLSF